MDEANVQWLAPTPLGIMYTDNQTSLRKESVREKEDKRTRSQERQTKEMGIQ